MANYELSNRIYELRTQKGLSQKELGAILGVSNKAVSKWETGTALPKTETLIKLAKVFDVSTEELLNTALPLQNVQPTSESIMMDPTNARMGKTLGEFRAENGLYLKDISEKIGVSEDELQSIEDSNLVPYEIAERLVVAYNLSENNFARPIFKSKKVTKKHFLKISAVYEIIIGVVSALPMFIGSVLFALGTILDSDALSEASRWANEAYYFVSPIITIAGCILLGKYLKEKTGYIGNFDKYKFLYAAVPSAAAVAVTAFGNFVVGMLVNSFRDNPDEFSSIELAIAADAVSVFFSLIGTIIIIAVLALLMDITIEQSPEKRRASFKKISMLVTVSALLAFVIEAATEYIVSPTYIFSFHSDVLPHALNIAIVWLVYSITEGNPKKEKWAFRILPIISACNVAVLAEIIAFCFILPYNMLEELSESRLPF